MYGYKVNIKGLPETVWACSTTVDNYNWENKNDERTIEIAISVSKSGTMIINDKTYFLQEGTRLGCVAGCEKMSSFCDSGVQHEITTVAVRFDNVHIISSELQEKDADDNSYFLLPVITEDPYLIQTVTQLLNKYIDQNVSDTSYDKALCTSIWFNILYFIDKHTRLLLCQPKSKSENYYVKKVNYIINTRYEENLSLTKIAQELGVSMSYLSSIYSSATQQCFKTALFSVRMKKAKELILSTSQSLADIATAVGICDDTYLRKCFKKFYGVSISELKKINKELTLYHEKPIRK